MKKYIFTAIASVFFAQVMLSQSSDHIEGGLFSKKVEYNILIKGVKESDNQYNLDSKRTLDRVFFGETNSPVEFVIQTSFEGASGFRIKKKSDSSYRIEVMNLPNSDEVIDRLSKKENEIHIPYELQGGMTLDGLNQINEYNKKVVYAKRNGEIYKPFRPKSRSFPISKQLAEALHGKMVLLIAGFKAEGVPPLISDGCEVTFRSVVGDELWTLIIHSPQKRALLLSDLCRQIITDSNNGKLNENKYLELLNEID